MVNKKALGIIIGFAVIMLTTLFVSCSTFPTVQASGNNISYTIIGYVGLKYASYEEAFNEARKKYPAADGVVLVVGRATDNLITTQMAMGYYAVKFKEPDPNAAAPAPEKKKFLGIF